MSLRKLMLIALSPLALCACSTPQPVVQFPMPPAALMIPPQPLHSLKWLKLQSRTTENTTRSLLN